MKLLLEITDKALGIGALEQYGQPYKLRKSARAVLFNKDGQVAIQNIVKFNHHKLPGGGFLPGEEIEEALRREIKEETGFDIDIQQPLGIIIEYRNNEANPEDRLIHISYGYIAHTVGEVGVTAYDQGEMDDDIKLEWVSLDEAVRIFEKDTSEVYIGKFMIARDLALLKEAKCYS